MLSAMAKKIAKAMLLVVDEIWLQSATGVVMYDTCDPFPGVAFALAGIFLSCGGHFIFHFSIFNFPIAISGRGRAPAR
jgi:hypothetical protein